MIQKGREPVRDRKKFRESKYNNEREKERKEERES